LEKLTARGEGAGNCLACSGVSFASTGATAKAIKAKKSRFILPYEMWRKTKAEANPQ
jgi:hypothetical protein